MNDADNRQLPIARIDAGRRSALRLRGSVLELTESGWTGSATTMIPVEWITVTRQERRSIRPVVRWLAGVVAVTAMCASVPVLVFVWMGLDAVPPFAVWLVAGILAAVFGAALAGGIPALGKNRPVVIIYIEAEPEPWRIEFWHEAHKDPSLEAMVSRLEVVQKEAERDDAPPPLQMTYTTYRVHPFRIVLMRTIGITSIITAPVIAIAWYFRQPLVLLMLAAPAVVYFGRLAVSALFWRRAPFVFREAVRRFESGKYDEAHRLVSKVLNDFPDALPAHMLSVQIDLRRGQFDRAMRGCHAVSRLDEEAGQELLEEVWTVKRLRERMDVEL